MSEQNNSRISENIKKAYIQGFQGCGRASCLNKHCQKMSKGIFTDLSKMALELIEIAKKSTGGDIANSHEFVFCDPYIEYYSAEQLLKEDPATIMSVFSDITSLGNSIKSMDDISFTDPSID